MNTGNYNRGYISLRWKKGYYLPSQKTGGRKIWIRRMPWSKMSGLARETEVLTKPSGTKQRSVIAARDPQGGKECIAGK